MAKSTKKFFVTRTTRKYDGSVYYRPCCYARFATMAEAEAEAEKLNQWDSKEKREKMYRGWVADPEHSWCTEEWFERQKSRDFYSTYEAKETK